MSNRRQKNSNRSHLTEIIEIAGEVDRLSLQLDRGANPEGQRRSEYHIAKEKIEKYIQDKEKHWNERSSSQG